MLCYVSCESGRKFLLNCVTELVMVTWHPSLNPWEQHWHNGLSTGSGEKLTLGPGSATSSNTYAVSQRKEAKAGPRWPTR